MSRALLMVYLVRHGAVGARADRVDAKVPIHCRWLAASGV